MVCVSVSDKSNIPKPVGNTLHRCDPLLNPMNSAPMVFTATADPGSLMGAPTGEQFFTASIGHEFLRVSYAKLSWTVGTKDSDINCKRLRFDTLDHSFAATLLVLQ